MQKPGNENIQQATERVKERLPLEKIRSMPKYKDLSAEEYEKLIKDAETFALLILKTFFSNNK
nr:hypothetical protein [uncultured Draconibacterium sp.]